MEKEVEVASASKADLAADMEHHRSTYRHFFNILKYSIAGLAVVLLVLFLALRDRGTL